MVIALDAGNIDDSNGEETVVFLFQGKTQREKQSDNSSIHLFLLKSIFSFCFLFMLRLKVKNRQGYVSEHLTLD